MNNLLCPLCPRTFARPQNRYSHIVMRHTSGPADARAILSNMTNKSEGILSNTTNKSEEVSHANPNHQVGRQEHGPGDPGRPATEDDFDELSIS